MSVVDVLGDGGDDVSVGPVGRLRGEGVFYWGRRQLRGAQHQETVEHGEGEANQLNHLHPSALRRTAMTTTSNSQEHIKKQGGGEETKLESASSTPRYRGKPTPFSRLLITPNSSSQSVEASPPLLGQNSLHSVHSGGYDIQQSPSRLSEEQAVHAHLSQIRPAMCKQSQPRHR